MRLEATGERILTARLEDKLYILNGRALEVLSLDDSSSTTAEQTAWEEQKLWHQRLGHIGAERLHQTPGLVNGRAVELPHEMET